MPDEIPPLPKEILEAASAGRLVVFVGAGLSRLVGCSGWKEFAINWLEHLYKNKAIDFYEVEKLKAFEPRRLLTLCDIIQRENSGMPEPEMKVLIQGSTEPSARQPIFDDLYSFNAVFITTNYDEYLDEAAKRATPNPGVAEPSTEGSTAPPLSEAKSFYLGKDLLESKLDSGNVLHIHGSLQDRQSMIVTIRDYIRHYQKGSDAQQLLEKLFEGSYRVLFIGYGLDELEILEFLVRGTRPGRGELQHYMLYPYFGEEQRLLSHHERYYQQLGVKLLPYSIGKGGYAQLGAIVHEWAAKIKPVARPMEFLERRKLLDEVA
jgi:hypothetical protein